MESPIASVSLRRVLVKLSHTTCEILSWNLLFHGQISSVFILFVDEIDLAQIALSCHFALDLLCYKVLTVLHVASSGTITRGSVLLRGTIVTPVTPKYWTSEA